MAGNLATQHVLKHRAPLPISDVLEDPRMASVRQQMQGRGTVSMLILPLLARDEIIGTIGLNHTERHEFTDEEVRLVFNMALSTAQSLATARMFDQIQVTLAELQRLEEARRQNRDELDRYLPDAIREKIEESYYARVNQQAELDQVVRSRQFIEDPLNHVALYSDHGVEHVRDVARNINHLFKVYCDQVVVKVMDAVSIEGFWKTLRHGRRHYPAIVVGSARFSGTDFSAAEAEIAQRVAATAA